MRPDDDAGEDVAEHHGLLEAVAQDGHQSGDHHDDGEVLKHGAVVHGCPTREGSGTNLAFRRLDRQPKDVFKATEGRALDAGDSR